jgi:hypothetical protein
MKKEETIYEKYKKAQAIGNEVEIPWEVRRFFPGATKAISFSGSDISVGEDYGSLENLQAAVEWFVKQFGGKVTWPK